MATWSSLRQRSIGEWKCRQLSVDSSSMLTLSYVHLPRSSKAHRYRQCWCLTKIWRVSTHCTLSSLTTSTRITRRWESCTSYLIIWLNSSSGTARIGTPCMRSLATLERQSRENIYHSSLNCYDHTIRCTIRRLTVPWLLTTTAVTPGSPSMYLLP
jgi:hypothetical protein